MRLLKIDVLQPDLDKLELLEVFGDEIPEYAILSHTWGRDEVIYEHVGNGSAHEHQAFNKISSAMKQAASDGHEYLWVDTCCIDKSSSAELSEAINSMYAWYRRAQICYAILEDVPGIQAAEFETKFVASRWFTRGWTLQELLAPKQVLFFQPQPTGTWTLLGNRHSLQELISKSTTIDIDYLCGRKSIFSASIAERMSWAARRQTSREEDIAYCLMGIFSVNMPMLYGEGAQAFMRLQKEIMSISDDQSIFAWTEASVHGAATSDTHSIFERLYRPYNKSEPHRHGIPDGPDLTVASDSEALASHGLLANSPEAFTHSGRIVPWVHPEYVQMPYQLTNRGVSIRLHLNTLGDFSSPRVADLQCFLKAQCDGREFLPIGVYMRKLSVGADQYARIRVDKLVILDKECSSSGHHHSFFVRQTDAQSFLVSRGYYSHYTNDDDDGGPPWEEDDTSSMIKILEL